MKILHNGIHFKVICHQNNSALPYLVMLHGFMGTGNVFSHLIHHLLPFCNPVTADLLGHGQTDGAKTVQRFCLANQLEDVGAILHSLPGSQTILYGYSMGGRLALQFACRHSTTLKALILESTTPGISKTVNRNVRKKKDLERAQKIEADFTGFLEEWDEMPLLQPSITAPDKGIRKYRTIQKNQDPKQMSYSLRAFGSGVMPPCQKLLPEISVPTLLLAGGQDEKFVLINTNVKRLIPNSVLTIVPKAGHRIHLDQPQILAKKIRHFIKEIT